MTRPRNSLGRPWAPGQRWLCDRCGQGGDDRDDVALPGCVGGQAQPHADSLRFEPVAHSLAISARAVASRASRDGLPELAESVLRLSDRLASDDPASAFRAMRAP